MKKLTKQNLNAIVESVLTEESRWFKMELNDGNIDEVVQKIVSYVNSKEDFIK